VDQETKVAEASTALSYEQRLGAALTSLLGFFPIEAVMKVGPTALARILTEILTEFAPPVAPPSDAYTIRLESGVWRATPPGIDGEAASTSGFASTPEEALAIVLGRAVTNRCPGAENRRLMEEIRQRNTRKAMASGLERGSIVECSCGAFVGSEYLAEHRADADEDRLRLLALTGRAQAKGGE
jgi:hypothetical protein